MSDSRHGASIEDASSCSVLWAGQDLRLLAERAVWWPEPRVLFISDLHIGKAATYRALGQPVPGGTTQQNLTRLSRLIETHRPLQIVFLGDFLHAAQAQTPQVLAALQTWREQHLQPRPQPPNSRPRVSQALAAGVSTLEVRRRRRRRRRQQH